MSDFKTFKAEKGTTHRIALAWLGEPGESPYLQRAGERAEIDQFARTDTDPETGSQNLFDTAILRYKTDENGQLPLDADGQPQIEYEVMHWRFPERTRSLLLSWNEDFPLNEYDLLATQIDGYVERETDNLILLYSFRPCQKTSNWRDNSTERAEIRQQVCKIIETKGNRQ